MDSSTTMIISTGFMVILAIEGIWWIMWMVITAARKTFANFYFMLITFIIWGVIGIITIIRMNPNYAIIDVILAIVPFFILPGMVKIITEYQKGVLFRFGGVAKT